MVDDILREVVEKITLTDDPNKIYSELIGIRTFLVDILSSEEIKYFDEKICIKITVVGQVPVGGGLFNNRTEIMDFSSLDNKRIKEHKQIAISYFQSLIKKIQMYATFNKPDRKMGF